MVKFWLCIVYRYRNVSYSKKILYLIIYNVSERFFVLTGYKDSV